MAEKMADKVQDLRQELVKTIGNVVSANSQQIIEVLSDRISEGFTSVTIQLNALKVAMVTADTVRGSAVRKSAACVKKPPPVSGAEMSNIERLDLVLTHKKKVNQFPGAYWLLGAAADPENYSDFVTHFYSDVVVKRITTSPVSALKLQPHAPDSDAWKAEMAKLLWPAGIRPDDALAKRLRAWINTRVAARDDQKQQQNLERDAAPPAAAAPAPALAPAAEAAAAVPDDADPLTDFIKGLSDA